MTDEIFIGKNAQDAYDQIHKKYGQKFKLINAKQVRYKNGEMRFEITVAVEQKIEERYFSQDIHEVFIEESNNQDTQETQDNFITIFNNENEENIPSLPSEFIQDDEDDENRLLKEEISKLKQEMEFFKNEVIEKDQNSSIINTAIDLFSKHGISREWLQETINLITD